MVPLSTIAPCTVLPPLIAMPVFAVSVPVFAMLPATVEPNVTTMPPPPAEIVPPLLMPPENVAMSAISMPADLPATLPPLLMPPVNAAPVTAAMPKFPPATVPLLLMPPVKVENSRDKNAARRAYGDIAAVGDAAREGRYLDENAYFLR